MYSVLFRCHKSDVYGLAVTAANLITLAEQNPGLPIHVVHGGQTSRTERLFAQVVRRFCASYTRLPEGMPPTVMGRSHWWAHGDLAVLEWYRREGHRHRIGQLYVQDWDVVLGEPVADLCRRVPTDALGLTLLKPFGVLEKIKWDWLVAALLRPQAEQLRTWVEQTYSYRGPHFGCWFTATVLPELFIERYAQQPQPPAVSADEVRLPMIAQALGFGLRDTGLADDAPVYYKYMYSDKLTSLVLLANGRLPINCRLYQPVRSLDAALLLRARLAPRRRRAHGLQPALGTP